MGKKKTTRKKLRVSRVVVSLAAVLCLLTYCSEGAPVENIPETTEQSEAGLSRDFIYSLREQINETPPETAPETIQETVPETVPETAPETVPETVPEIVPETAPETAPETVTQPAITILHNDSSMTAELISQLEGIAVFWAPTGNKMHIKPDCRSFKKGYTYAGTYEEALSVRTDGWCGICSKGIEGAISSNGNATSNVLASCYTCSDYLSRVPAAAFDE